MKCVYFKIVVSLKGLVKVLMLIFYILTTVCFTINNVIICKNCFTIHNMEFMAEYVKYFIHT